MLMPAAAVAAVAVAARRCCACPVLCAGLAARSFSKVVDLQLLTAALLCYHAAAAEYKGHAQEDLAKKELESALEGGWGSLQWGFSPPVCVHFLLQVPCTSCGMLEWVLSKVQSDGRSRASRCRCC